MPLSAQSTYTYNNTTDSTVEPQCNSGHSIRQLPSSTLHIVSTSLLSIHLSTDFRRIDDFTALYLYVDPSFTMKLAAILQSWKASYVRCGWKRER